MKILIVNTFDRGGAGSACLRLHIGLLQAGLSSRVLLREKLNQTPQTFVLKPRNNRNLFQKIANKSGKLLRLCGISKKSSLDERLHFLEKRNEQFEFFSFPESSYDITTSKLYKEADIINLHWVADFLDFGSFFNKNTKPIVWTLHDMNPFTGGEHYKEEYLGMDEKGFPISRKVSESERKVFRKNIELKMQSLIGVNNLYIVTLCKWMEGEVRRSDLFNKFPNYLIPNGLNSEIFLNRGKGAGRKHFNIPKEKKVILFVSDLIEKERKGFIYLKKAFELLNDEDIIFCSIGGQTKKNEINNQHIPLGTIKDEITMSYAYSAADVFVIPSLMDNLPNTVLESLMCGTPVIGFPVGGIIDMVQHGKNGYITEEISVPSLVKTLNLFLSDGDKFDSKIIREDALSKYDLNIQAEKYLQLFKSILNK